MPQMANMMASGLKKLGGHPHQSGDPHPEDRARAAQ